MLKDDYAVNINWNRTIIVLLHYGNYTVYFKYW